MSKVTPLPLYPSENATTQQLPGEERIKAVLVRCDEPNKYIGKTRFFLDTKSRRELLRNCGDQGYMLYEYYLAMATYGDQPMTDHRVCAYYDWHLAKVARNRKKLIQHGWFRTFNLTAPGGGRIAHYFIGKKAVAQSYKDFPK